MSKRWFRFYADALHNPKVQKLPPALFKAWVNILCVASKRDGEIPPAEDLRFELGVRYDIASSWLARLYEFRMLVPSSNVQGGFVPHDWSEHQYKSDTSTDRVREHRAKRNVSCNNIETPPDTDTDTDTEKPPKSPKGDRARSPSKSKGKIAYPDAFEKLWSAYPSRPNQSKAKALEAWLRFDDERREGAVIAAPIFADQCRKAGTEPQFIPHLTTWLNERRFDEFVEYDDDGEAEADRTRDPDCSPPAEGGVPPRDGASHASDVPGRMARVHEPPEDDVANPVLQSRGGSASDAGLGSVLPPDDAAPIGLLGGHHRPVGTRREWQLVEDALRPPPALAKSDDWHSSGRRPGDWIAPHERFH